MKVTIKEIAKLANVSPTTVSRALGGYGYVSKETKEQVFKVAEKLNYTPNMLAKSMVTGKTKNIGLIIGDIENPFFSTLAKAVNDFIISENYNLLIANTYESQEEEKKIISSFLQKQVDGIIIATSYSNDEKNGKNVFNDFFKSKTPIVLVDRSLKWSKIDSVTSKNFEGGYEATKYLIEKGHKKIGFLGDFLSISSTSDRYEGYKKALEDFEIPFNKSYVKFGSFTVLSGYRKTVELFSQDDKPTAVFTSHSLMSVGLLFALKDMNIKLNEINMIGFDDLDWFTLLTPPISAVEQQVKEMGEYAARLLIKRIEGFNGPIQQICLPVTMKIRGT
mgnify:CR=1 FL=1